MKTENEKTRELYESSGIHYADIHKENIDTLMYLIDCELKKSGNNLQMELCKLRKCDVSYAPGGSIERCHIMVDGFYFKRREAISFNRKDRNGGEFIGFAGWAGSENVKPFIDAFRLWLKGVRIPF